MRLGPGLGLGLVEQQRTFMRIGGGAALERMRGRMVTTAPLVTRFFIKYYMHDYCA